MDRREIVLPDTRPEIEWVRGRALQKVSPTRDHSVLQAQLSVAFVTWAGALGEVGSEWRFRVAPPGGPRRPLVPDLAFVRVERLRGLSGRNLQYPKLAPDVVVEILSPKDRSRDVADKIATYLAAGSTLVIVVDPVARAVVLHDGEGRRQLDEGDTFVHPALPGFALALAPLFAKIQRPQR